MFTLKVPLISLCMACSLCMGLEKPAYPEPIGKACQTPQDVLKELKACCKDCGDVVGCSCGLLAGTACCPCWFLLLRYPANEAHKKMEKDKDHKG